MFSFGLALTLGVLAVVVAKASMKGSAATPAAVVQVVVARNTLPAGARIGRDQLVLAPWTEGAPPQGAFTSIDTVIDIRGDRYALRAIAANEPILADKVSAPGARATLSSIVGHDMRAVTIRVNDVLGVAGFILPGDRVDVLLTRSANASDAATDILLQSVRVLGVDQEAGEIKDKAQVARAVTLEVDPDDAQKLALASAAGTLTLALRNSVDGDQAHARTVRLEDLRITPPRAPVRAVHAAPPPVAAGPTVAILRGIKSDIVEVSRGDESEFRHSSTPPP
jgi:pilus assembly protein CpaB